MKSLNRQSGQAIVETALTLMVMFPLLLFFAQLCFWLFAAQQIHSAVLVAAQSGAQSGNPDYTDQVLIKELKLLTTKNRELFTQNFQVHYFTSENADFTVAKEWQGGPGGACAGTGGSRWLYDTRRYDCTWKFSDGAVQVVIDYNMPIHLAPFGWLSTVHAEAVSYIECTPSENKDDIALPFCRR